MTEDICELVRRCQAGDETAVRQFVERFQQAVFAVCLRMLGHRHDAEDAAQDTLLRAIRHLGRWDPGRPFLPWLLTIASNRCRTAMERRARRPSTTDRLPEPEAQAATPIGELGEELRLALNQLREDYQTCFLLFHQQELSCAEIADCMGVPEGTVKTWLHRARRELAQQLRRRGVIPEGRHELR